MLIVVEGNWWWHGEVSVRQHTRTWDIYRVTKRKLTQLKMILHALDATANGATQLQIHSPDTDVFVLALMRYPELCKNTLFVTGRGQHHPMIELKTIV